MPKSLTRKVVALHGDSGQYAVPLARRRQVAGGRLAKSRGQRAPLERADFIITASRLR